MAQKNERPAKKRTNNKRLESVFISKVIGELITDGYIASRVDRYNVFSRRCSDLFGIADVLALPTCDTGQRPMLVQVTSIGNKNARIKKIEENEIYHKLKATCEIVVATLEKNKGRWVVQWHQIE